jgi:hypothetical protein
MSLPLDTKKNLFLEATTREHLDPLQWSPVFEKPTLAFTLERRDPMFCAVQRKLDEMERPETWRIPSSQSREYAINRHPV